MHVIHPVYCGIDGHPAQLTACLRCVSHAGQITTTSRDCGTAYGERLVLRTWLTEPGCPVVVMESTGVY